LHGEKVLNLFFVVFVGGGVEKRRSAKQEDDGQQEITAFAGHGEHPCAMGWDERTSGVKRIEAGDVRLPGRQIECGCAGEKHRSDGPNVRRYPLEGAV
jgi:hypothetical protein